MHIRDIARRDVIAGDRWRLTNDSDPMASIVDWEVEPCSDFAPTDTVVYSAITVFEDGEVRPIVVVREIATHDWWGDTCELVDGEWRELAPEPHRNSESYVANPLPEDPSFVGAYSHEDQRAGFARWVKRV